MKNIAMGVVVRDGKVLIQKRFRRGQGMVFEFPGVLLTLVSQVIKQQLESCGKKRDCKV